MRTLLFLVLLFTTTYSLSQQTLSITNSDLPDSTYSNVPLNMTYQLNLSQGAVTLQNDSVVLVLGREYAPDSIIVFDSVLVDSVSISGSGSVLRTSVVTLPSGHFPPGNNTTVVIWPVHEDLDRDSLYQDVYIYGPGSIVEREESVLTAYPNPSSEWISFQFEGVVSTEDVELYDLEGRLIKRWRGVDSINISWLSNGAYFLRVVSSDGAVHTKRILVRK